jgi:Fe-S-cluster-containing dehydrogenase component
MCEMACSVEKTGVFRPRSARIWIETDARVGRDVPHVCQQNIKACREKGSSEPRCAAACPLARDPDPPLYWDDSLAVMVLRPKKECKTCGACASACRFKAIRIDPAEGLPIKCDLCSGEPECVQVCVTDAIRYEREEEPQS